MNDAFLIAAKRVARRMMLVRLACLCAVAGGVALCPECAPKWNVQAIRKGDRPTFDHVTCKN
jgi:hypothetical protein